ncbi:hypothetical protein M8C21_028536 [Ambrosia artemisiifolia]|uniref:RRM domain-containing protein n=1 Tax=Ambrosia artemisiifolia TaxID=4212 RepID=A0AAD5GM29_AMBAR|nr:hypothetical protein M8C21_028536 [Ambrosia artemisiifolia]
MQTGVLEKPVAGAVPVKNIVEDSPNKMFIGGISKFITSEMLMEIASAFGPLKAFHFEDNAHLHSPCAFVEYADQSVTVKACVGLNGMKLGGQVLTVTQATPDVSLVGNHGNQPYYGTPVHARPLLEKPTQVLKLSNVLDPHSLPSLSESELEEILEDIRLECARFGVVKSINIIKQTEMPTSSETVEATREAKSMADEATKEASPMADEATKEASPMADEAIKEASPMADETTKGANPTADEAAKEANPTADVAPKEADPMADEAANEDKPMVDEATIEANPMADEVTERSCSDKLQQHEELAGENNSYTEPEKVNRVNGIIGNKHENKTGKDETCDDIEKENRSLKVESDDTMKNISDLIDAFEVGCVFVEYKRTEASSMAAHCLHGRVFDGRSVSVEYVAYDVYRTRFQK